MKTLPVSIIFLPLFVGNLLFAQETGRQNDRPGDCGLPFADARDGKIYNTVLIGKQCWMAQNLNTGTEIPDFENQANNSIIEKYCYNNDDANCTVYGGLYQWGEIVQYLNGATDTTSWNPIPSGNIQGICPPGWHIPTDGEWTTLATYLGGDSFAGGKMKEAGTVHWLTPNTLATNSSGFTALPGGNRFDYGDFSSLFQFAFFGSSSQKSDTNLWDWGLSFASGYVFQYDDYKAYGYSVRCIRD